MNNIAKVCIAAGSGFGMCATVPAWASVAIVAIMTVEVVSLAGKR